jgi:hypothetical protein
MEFYASSCVGTLAVKNHIVTRETACYCVYCTVIIMETDNEQAHRLNGDCVQDDVDHQRCELSMPGARKPDSHVVCEKVSSQMKHLHKYLRIQVGAQKPWKCSACRRAFIDFGQLKSHVISIHRDKRPVNCQECDASFNCSMSLRNHIFRYHDLGKKRNTCEYCQRAFLLPSMLRHHIKTCHEPVKRFKCDDCDATFAAKGI